MSETESVRLGFVCVQNAGRSQMASAFAERERADRGLKDTVEILSGGTYPAENVHEEVIEVMHEEGFDLAGRTPRAITTEELESCAVVATMGCSSLDVGTADAKSGTEIRGWALSDPEGEGLDAVREIREEIRGRVRALFDELESEMSDELETASTA